MTAWFNAAIALGAIAIIAGWFALVANAARERQLRKWKRRAERTHAYFENMRRVHRQA